MKIPLEVSERAATQGFHESPGVRSIKCRRESVNSRIGDALVSNLAPAEGN